MGYLSGVTLNVKYCDNCKWDEVTGSYKPPLTKCPKCGEELYEAESYDQIP